MPDKQSVSKEVWNVLKYWKQSISSILPTTLNISYTLLENKAHFNCLKSSLS